MKKLLAEGVGTFWLVLGGCGTAVFAAKHVGVLGVAIAFGLTVVTMAYAIGPISGCHLNPAVTVGLVVAGRHPAKELLGYVIAQCVGAIVAAALIYVVAGETKGGYDLAGGLASNGYGDHSPDGYGMIGGLISEIMMTALFLVVILGATDKASSPAMAGLAIGLCLTLIHLISIPITNTSVNPARSLGPALMVRGWALEQLWLFIVAPIAGAALGAMIYRTIATPSEAS